MLPSDSSSRNAEVTSRARCRCSGDSSVYTELVVKRRPHTERLAILSAWKTGCLASSGNRLAYRPDPRSRSPDQTRAATTCWIVTALHLRSSKFVPPAATLIQWLRVSEATRLTKTALLGEIGEITDPRIRQRKGHSPTRRRRRFGLSPGLTPSRRLRDSELWWGAVSKRIVEWGRSRSLTYKPASVTPPRRVGIRIRLRVTQVCLTLSG